MKRFGRAARIVAGASALILLGINIASAATCALSDEELALDTRVLQSELMVAALTCNEQASYGAFVKKFESVLVSNGNTFREYFQRTYGAAGESHMNRMVTRLANNASAHAMSLSAAAYCASQSTLFSQVLALSPRDFPAYVTRLGFVAEHGVRPCTQQAARDERR